MKEYKRKHNQKPEVKEYHRKYHQRPKIKEKKYTYHKNRKKTDSQFKLRCNISSALYRALTSRSLSKQGQSTFDLIGYTKQELIEHLESLLTEGMSWKNYGKWVIDHIIPDIFFNYDDKVEFLYCWSFNNLQPMWEKPNLEKSDKMMLWGKEIRARDFNYFFN